MGSSNWVYLSFVCRYDGCYPKARTFHEQKKLEKRLKFLKNRK